MSFLAYPLRAWLLVLILAAVWATTILILGSVLPDRWSVVDVLAHSPVLMVVLVLFGYTMAFLQITHMAARGEKLAWSSGPNAT